MIVILMGPAGSGKTTVGSALAAALGWPFFDADDLHLHESVEKMRAGVALTDDDRAPWLARVHALVERLSQQGGHAVIACSALKERYRDAIADGVRDVRWVFLEASPDLLRGRLVHRPDHFAGAALLPSQLTELERPADALTVDADRPVDAIVAEIRAAMR